MESTLNNRDYTLIIDKSGSMNETDCPNGRSRWQYMQESALAIAAQVAKLDPDGMTVIPFSGNFKTYENVGAEKVKDIFTEQSPMGSTILAPVLKSAFDSYLKRKAKGETKANGEMLLVVTDGQPEDETQVAQEIINFTKKLENGDGEYGITFVQIGKDQGATNFLRRLDDGLEKQGAKFDIVDTKTIDEVEQLGLTETLMAALND